MPSVLVVDDAKLMRETISCMLEEIEFEVIGEAENGQQAVERYRELQPDVVTMDLTMPIMSGIDAAKMIIEEFPRAKIIMVTALGQQKLIVEALENGVKDFVTKPFDRRQIENVLNNVVR